MYVSETEHKETSVADDMPSGLLWAVTLVEVKKGIYKHIQDKRIVMLVIVLEFVDTTMV
jgi:hypothetical protein